MSSAPVAPEVTAVGRPRVRGGPQVNTLRRDRWWLQPLVSAIALAAFVGYATWSAFNGTDYYAGPKLGRDYLSPFFSPCITQNCPFKFGPIVGPWYHISPAIIILVAPLGFRLTCYYYRRTYYRSFWLSPPACAVADAHRTYSGETRFPLILQNIHRYFFYVAVALNCVLTFDAVESFRFPGGIGMGLGSLIFVINAALLWLYTISCHSCRHICGGRLDSFSKHPIRRRLWRFLTPLNARHNLFAWASLFWVAFTDIYVRLVASGTIHDPRFF